jgi:hypothetical protein
MSVPATASSHARRTRYPDYDQRPAEDDLLTVSAGLSQLRPHYTTETRELFGALLNATSAAEASLALEVLGKVVPEKPLVTACNLREVLQALPTSPFVMSVDEATLTRVAKLERDIAVLRKLLPDDIEICATTAGNLVLDLIVRNADGVKLYWTPIPVTHDFVNPQVVDLVIDSEFLLVEVIELVKCMGVVFNPKFYLSIEDFRLEYAADMIGALDDLF